VSQHAGAVDITFRHMTPSDELVYFIRRHCRRVDVQQGDRAEWWILLVREPGVGRFQARVIREAPKGEAEATELDPDPYLAVRNAFEVLSGRCAQPARPELDSGVYPASAGDPSVDKSFAVS
jgi:hypothetical protein